MLNDRELEQATAQLQNFRVQTASYQKDQSQLIEKYYTLIENYKRLKSDYEEERDSRERYKQMARGQERSPFVLVLIDGDGYLFDDDLISTGSDGGTRAGQLLNDAVKASLRSRNLDLCRIVVRVYANLSGLSRALSKSKLCGAEKRSLSPFVSGFNHSNALFDFVDAGELKESADFKIRASFRQFVENAQCKHIFFAACHDVAYVSELQPYITKREHITLVRSHGFHPEFPRLGFRCEEFHNIFRSSPLPTTDVLPVLKKGITPPITVNHSSATPVDLSNVCSFYQKGLCKYGTTCKYVHARTGANGYSTEIKDWRKDASPNKSTGPSIWDSSSPVESEDVIDAEVDFVSLLPRDEDVPEGHVPINEHNQRLDSYLSPPTNEDRAHFNARTARQKLCNNAHLNGHCSQGPGCQYDHSEITQGMLSCLKQIAHNNPCPRRGSCRASTCTYGHICQKPDCKYRGGRALCKFPQPAHAVDLNVYEYVPSTTRETVLSEHLNAQKNGHEELEYELKSFSGRRYSSSSATENIISPRFSSDRVTSPVQSSSSYFNPPQTRTYGFGEEAQEKAASNAGNDIAEETSDVASWWQQ